MNYVSFISFLVNLIPSSFLLNKSLAKASLRTSTKGPFPDRNTACSDSSILILSLAMFSPASVFPAPGTPVTKHIVFKFSFFDFSIIRFKQLAVFDRLIAPESCLEISLTL